MSLIRFPSPSNQRSRANNFPDHRRDGGRSSAPVLVLGLVASSLTLWPTSVSAAPVDVVDDTCIEILGVQWYLRDFDEPGSYSSQVDVDTDNGLVTFIGTVNSDEIDSYSPRIEFAGYLEACPPSGDSIPTGEPPKGIAEVCVVTTPGAVTAFSLKIRQWVVNADPDLSDFKDPDYDNAGEVPGTVVSFEDVLNDFGVTPSRIEAEEFVIDPSFTGSTIEVRIVLGADLLDDVNSPCVFPTGDDDGPSGGYDIDIDLDHYRNRAAVGAQALPDTL